MIQRKKKKITMKDKLSMEKNSKRKKKKNIKELEVMIQSFKIGMLRLSKMECFNFKMSRSL